MIRKKSISPAFLAIDFFSGAGGTTRGLIDADGYVIAGIDKDSSCKTTYRKNNKNRVLDEKYPQFLNYDIFPKTEEYPDGDQDLLFEKIEILIRKYRRLTNNRIPLLFAICAPCQPFTRLSKKEITEKRKKQRLKDSQLLQEALKFVERFRPEMLLSENVAGISKVEFSSVWGKFQKKLTKLGYATGTKVVCASEFGVPQRRKRSILIGIKKELLKQERYKNSSGMEILIPGSDPDSLTVTVKEAIGHLPSLKAGETHSSVPNHRTRRLSELNYKRLSLAKPGETNIYMEDTRYGDLSLKCHKKARIKHKKRCFSDFYTRMAPDQPAPTITTKCLSVSNGRYGHYDTKQVRGISLHEAAILQSFPDDYVFYNKDSLEVVARMIGNAVPPRLANFYARYLTESLNSIQ